jgi:hypothetical protein
MAVMLMVFAALMQGSPTPRSLDKGDQSMVEQARQAVAHTAAEWTALWKQHSPDRPQPAADFSREVVVAVFMGTRPTAGFAAEIVEALSGPDGALTIRYRERRPGRDMLTAQVITSPYHIVAVAKPSGAIRFEKID